VGGNEKERESVENVFFRSLSYDRMRIYIHTL